MPRYYFHVKEDDDVLHDPDGKDCAGLVAAKAEAAAVARGAWAEPLVALALVLVARIPVPVQMLWRASVPKGPPDPRRRRPREELGGDARPTAGRS